MNTVHRIEVWRGDYLENCHAAQVALYAQTPGPAQKFPMGETPADPAKLIFIRSAAKPFQAVPLLEAVGPEGLTPEEWAIVCASHGGTPMHLALVEQVLAKAHCTIGDLQCGPHLPLDAGAANALRCAGVSPTVLHDNCSGKHAGMLMACDRNGWPKGNYLDDDHPLQQAILKTIMNVSSFSGIGHGIDGCGAPVFALPLPAIAKMSAHLVSDPVYAPLTSAMTSFPEIVGSIGRIDTELMRRTHGQLLAKVGADGVLIVAHRDLQAGLAIKISDGSNAIRDRYAIHLLSRIGWIRNKVFEDLSKMSEFSPLRYNTRNAVIGNIRF